MFSLTTFCICLCQLWCTTWAMPVSDGPLEMRSTSNLSCHSSSFKKPKVFGAEIISVVAAEVHNYSDPTMNVTNLSFCSVNITYTHPGWNDTVLVESWLPLSGWNSRFQGVGGGGYRAGQDTAMAPAVEQGYAAAVTNAGHDDDSITPASWALSSPGNVNYDLLTNFATKSLDELPIIGKAITEDFYGKAPAFSYWNGCSNGGRQGVVSAQRYPTHYNGILAKAPAVYWAQLLPSLQWAQIAMFEEGVYPPLCELEAITAAAIKACDGLDGVIDGVISANERCNFDPHTVVGKPFNCTGTTVSITTQAATIVEKFWQGPRTSNNSFIWYGYQKDSSLAGVGNTTQYPNGTGAPAPFLDGAWFTYFLAKDPNFDVTSITYNEYATYSHQSVQEYDSIIGNDDPDLSAFKAAGGKMITWQGMADQIIPVNNSIRYYESVKLLDPQVEDFYRLFLAPGIGHCGGGVGYYPTDDLSALVKWVEEGVAPTELSGTSLTSGRSQPICMYPDAAKWDKVHNSSLLASYTCGS